MSYFNYWIYIVVIFVVTFLFAKTVSNEKQIVGFFSKLIYIVVIPCNIALSFIEIHNNGFNLNILAFVVYLAVFSKILSMIFQLNNREAETIEPAIVFSNIIVMRPFLEKAIDKNILNQVMIVFGVAYLVYLLYKGVHSVSDFLMALGFGVGFSICAIYGVKIVTEPLKMIVGCSGFVIIMAFSLSMGTNYKEMLLDLTAVMVSLINLLIIPIFTYVVVHAITNDLNFIKAIVMYAAIGSSFIIPIDYYKKPKLNVALISFLLSVITVPTIQYLFF